jgi:hypothetical protein
MINATRIKKLAPMHSTAGRQFEQLPMFMTGAEIKEKYEPLDGDRKWTRKPGSRGMSQETPDEMWDRKLDESKRTHWKTGANLYKDIKKNGVQNPVSLQWERERGPYTPPNAKPQVLGGHHRVAVAAAARPDDLIPVEHFQSFSQARISKGDRY